LMPTHAPATAVTIRMSLGSGLMAMMIPFDVWLLADE
jgi:hypothetical protein